MTGIAWWIVGLYLTIAVIMLIVNAWPHAQEQAVLRLERSVGIDLPNRLGQRLRLRLLSSRRSSIVGGMIGITLSALATALPTPSPWSALDPVVLVAGTFAGMAAGTSIAAIRSARPVADDLMRYARAVAVELDDYIAPLERWLGRAPVALAVASLIALAIFAQRGLVHYASAASFISAGLLVLAAVISLVIFETIGRRVVAMGNSVSSPEELVWEDAARALTLRELAAAPTFLGFYGILMSINPLVVTPERGATGYSVASLGISLITVVVAGAMLVSALRMQRHFLRRLWPELAAEADTPRPVEADA